MQCPPIQLSQAEDANWDGYRRRRRARIPRQKGSDPVWRVRLRRAFGVAREAVVRDVLPGGGVRAELAQRRADAGISVERPEADAHDVRVVGAAAPEGRSARAAEQLGEAVGRRVRA